jgi:DNA transposition AAA+ family ATPase
MEATMSSDEKQPMEQLAEQGRVLGPSRVIRDGAAVEAVTREQMAAVVAAISSYQQRTGLRWKEIARSSGVRASAISSIINGNAIAGWRGIVIDLDRWLEEELKREAAPKPTDFVLTRVAEEVCTVANAAATLKCIGLVFGWSGMGKTMALQAVAAEKPGTILVTMKTAACSPMAVLQAIASAAGIRQWCEDQRGLMLRLEQLLRGTPRLIIIDEIHKLTGGRDDKALHVLRDLHDATGCPQLWSGTIDLIAYLERRQASGREPLAQIRRRIGIARNLVDRGDGGGGGGDGGEPLYSIDEIRAVFARGKMRLTPQAVRYLWMLANLPDSGALGTCRNLVVMATKVNEASADTLTDDMLRSVHRLLVSTRDYTLLQERMKDTAPPRPAARVG